MMCLLILVSFWAISSYLYSLISTNPWLWFAWVPLGLITTLLLFLAWIFLIVLPIISKVNPNSKELGRSVYVCKNAECIKVFIKKKKLKTALKYSNMEEISRIEELLKKYY